MSLKDRKNNTIIATMVSLQARLSLLEAKLGLSSPTESSTFDDNDTASTNKSSNSIDLNQRLALAEEAYRQKIVTTLGWETTWKESDALWRELDPGSALTYQTNSASSATSSSSTIPTLSTTSFQQPILYRRQEVLAATDSLQQDLELLKQALQLLQISSSSKTSSSSAVDTAVGSSTTTTTTSTTLLPLLREEQVTQAPILVDIIPGTSPDDSTRLERVQSQVKELNQRYGHAQRRIQQLVERYHTFMVTASEKLVLAEEQLMEQENK